MQAERKTVLNYIEAQYGAPPEYLWTKYPSYAVFRQQNNRKWFAVVMDIPRSKLGLTSEGPVSILNLKCDPRLIGSLRENGGFFPAYHMNKANWITVLLDGSVPMEELIPLLDMSYHLADNRRRGTQPFRVNSKTEQNVQRIGESANEKRTAKGL